MNAETQTLQDDLAFLRTLVQGGEDNWRSFGRGYLAAGLIYGGQMLLHLGQVFGALPSSGLPALLIAMGPTVVFLAVLSWLLARDRKSPPSGLTGRALGAVFASVGLANFGLIAVIGAVALREQSLTIWLIYPCTVFILQGAAWMVAFALRRRLWQVLIAVILFASAIAMAVSIANMLGFIVSAGLAFFLGMALPGWIMTRAPGAAAP